MGILRGAAKGLVGFIFLVLVSLLLINLTLYTTTKADFLRPLFVTLITEKMGAPNLDAFYDDAVKKCIAQEEYILPIENMTLTFPCSEIKQSSRGNFSKLVVEQLFDQKLYNRECYGLECLQKKDIPGFATKGFNLFLKDALMYVGIATVIFGILLFILSKGWASKFSGVGIPLFIMGLPFIFLKFFKQQINAGEFQFFIDKILEPLSFYMMISLIAGAALIVLAILSKIFKKKKKKKGGRKKKK